MGDPRQPLLRPVELELFSGERLEGLLVFQSDDALTLEVDTRTLVLPEPEVRTLRFLDGGEGWTEVAEDAPDPEAAPRGPVVLERIPLGADRVAGLNALALESGLQTHALVRAGSLPGLLGALEQFKADVFALYERFPTESRHSLPYLVTLDPEDRWPRSLLKRLGPAWGALIRSPAPAREVARLLTNLLRVRLDDAQERTFRFYDPRVLRDYLDVVEPSDAALLFGAAWCRHPRTGVEELLCPCCDAELPGLSLECPGCPARFAGDEAAPTLIGEWILEDPQDRSLFWRATLWPPRPERGRVPPARDLQRGRKQLRLRRAQVQALGRAYRAREEAR